MTRDDSMITPGRLIIAAASLVILGVMLLMSGDNDDEGSDAATNSEEGASPEEAPPDSPENVSPDVSTSDASTHPPDEETATPAELPPGMDRPGPTPAPRVRNVDDMSATAVAVAALTAVYSMDAMTDETAEAAFRRAEPWLAEESESEVYDLDDLEEIADEEWGTWSDHDAYTSLNSIDEVAPDHGGDSHSDPAITETVEKLTVSYTPLGRDGWNGAAETHVWYVHLRRESASAAWQIVEMRRPAVDPTAHPFPTDFPTPSSSSS